MSSSEVIRVRTGRRWPVLYHPATVLLVLCGLAQFLAAGTTGKIAGRVTDEKTGEPAVGVNVLVVGLSTGASTDLDGKYLIANLPPGEYSLSVSGVGFRKKIFQHVVVNVDFTTPLDITLSTEAVDLDAVVVTAERPLVRRDLTSSHASVDASQIQSMPVESVVGILTTQAGIIQDENGALHFRGGRSDEVSYTVNGVSINNPFTNTNSFSIATNAIQELSVVQGTFNAEYGNALSGVVETGLKEGGERYTGQLSFYTGDRISSHKDIFFNIGSVNPFQHTVTEGTFGGPVPLAAQSASFFISGRYDNEQGWLYGVRGHLPTDKPNTLADTNWIIPLGGDSAVVPMNPSTSLTLTDRFTVTLTPSLKLHYDFIFNEARYRSYSHAYKYNPDGTYHNYENDALHALEVTGVPDQTLFFSLKMSYRRNIYQSYIYNDFLDEHYMPIENSTRPAGTGFYLGGAGHNVFHRSGEVYALKFDASAQVSNSIEVKAGAEAQFPQMLQSDVTVIKDTSKYPVVTIPPETDLDNESYAKFPKQFSAYAQTKIEFHSFVMNAGLRYDYFFSNSDYVQDIYNPSAPRVNADAKVTVSPRLGISYPITDRGFIHFSYGHFYQMPQYRYLYVNSKYKYDATVSNTVFGDANLKPQLTVTYEFGLQQQLTDELAFTTTGFYKDVRDLFAVQTIRISQQESFSRYVNKDYANIKGITFSLVKRRTATDWLGASIDYTLQVAEGNDVNADAFFIDKESGRESEKRIVLLGWDQTHTLNGSVVVGAVNDWSVSIIGKVGTGLPYTPLDRNNDVEYLSNSARKPTYVTADLLAQKEFRFSTIGLVLFLKVFNLFDTLNELDVYQDTGRSTYTLAIQDGEGAAIDRNVGKYPGVHPMSDYFNNPTLFSSPREVRVGLTVNF